MWSSCDLPVPDPQTRWERLADRYRSIGDRAFRMPAGVLVAVAVALTAGRVPVRAGMTLDAAFFLAIGAYCAGNFWRCREAHCVVTGTGWSLGGLAAAAAAVGGVDWHDQLWIAFLIVWAAGYSFQLVVRRRSGTTALSRRSR